MRDKKTTETKKEMDGQTDGRKDRDRGEGEGEGGGVGEEGEGERYGAALPDPHVDLPEPGFVVDC